jgi:hypothetical protein
MDTGSGPFQESDMDYDGVNIDQQLFGIASSSNTLITTNIIIRQPNLSLVPDFTFVTSQNQAQKLGEDGNGVNDSSGLDIERSGGKGGRLGVEGEGELGKSDASEMKVMEDSKTFAIKWAKTTLKVEEASKKQYGLGGDGGTAVTATQGTANIAATWGEVQSEVYKDVKGDKGFEEIRGCAIMAMEGAERIAATWMTTPKISPTMRTTIKTSTVRSNDANFSTPACRNKSWSSRHSDTGGVMLHSLKPLSRVASSFVCPTPIRHDIVTSSKWRAFRDQSISYINDRAMQDSLSAIYYAHDEGLPSSPATIAQTDHRGARLQSSLNAVAPGNLEAIHDLIYSVTPTPLPFHPKSHHAQHEHHQSVTPGPFSCTQTNKYKLLHIPDTPLTCDPKAELDVNNLTDNLQSLALRRPASPWVYSPAAVRKALRQWQYDEQWMENAAQLEAKNRFRGVDLNYGWNRATASLINYTDDAAWVAPYFEGGPEMRMKIMETLNRFSLWAQLEPIMLHADEAKGMFEMVFVGKGLGNSRWARKPGSWWGSRKKLFDGHRGRSFLEELALLEEEIENGRRKWKRENKGKLFAIGTLKRKARSVKAKVDAEDGAWRKRIKMPKTKSEQVMSEEWRTRRREQEKKAGRWTDGTFEMDRMWAEFHWVLNSDDPMHHLDQRWPQDVFKGSYY